MEKDKNKKKNTIEPIIVSVIFMLYYCLYFGIIIYEIGTCLAILLGIIPIALCIAMVFVCKERLKEWSKKIKFLEQMQL